MIQWEHFLRYWAQAKFCRLDVAARCSLRRPNSNTGPPPSIGSSSSHHRQGGGSSLIKSKRWSFSLEMIPTKGDRVPQKSIDYHGLWRPKSTISEMLPNFSNLKFLITVVCMLPPATDYGIRDGRSSQLAVEYTQKISTAEHREHQRDLKKVSNKKRYIF